jgi:two-component system nitrate/nitrite sensor histidine kinase NarX
LQPLVELELLRICQEALTNVRLHAGASQVKVTITKTNGWLTIVVTDNGCGFVMGSVRDDAVGPQRHGLQVMKERAKSIGGGVWVMSVPGHGTEVRVEIPPSSSKRSMVWRDGRDN